MHRMKSFFLSSGPNPYAHLGKCTTTVPSAPFEGLWATVDIQPDPFARQRYTVGVVVSAPDGDFDFRLLDDFSRFECFLGKSGVEEMKFWVDEAERGLARAKRDRLTLPDASFEVDTVMLGDLWPTSGDSFDSVLLRLYRQVIPFHPKDVRKIKIFDSLDNTAVRNLVNNELKRIANLDFERISTEPQRAVLDATTGQRHWLDFNLEPEGKAGSVISAVYKTPSTIELNFLRASRDLATYARMKSLNNQLGLFVMTPKMGVLSDLEHDRIENVLGEQSWRLEQQGFRVVVHEEPILLANEVWEWAGVVH